MAGRTPQLAVGVACSWLHRWTCLVSHWCSRSQRFNDWFWKGN